MRIIKGQCEVTVITITDLYMYNYLYDNHLINQINLAISGGW